MGFHGFQIRELALTPLMSWHTLKVILGISKQSGAHARLDSTNWHMSIQILASANLMAGHKKSS